MRWGNSDGWREEFKYWITPAMAERIRSFISPFVTTDPHAEQSPTSSYVVRSIYYDTPGFDFYYHKLEGLKVRKKLRIRGYNHTQPSDRVFLEIKHKMGRKIFKERAALPFSQTGQLLRPGSRIIDETMEDWGRQSRMAAHRFFWLQERLGLKPVILVVYLRRAFVCRFNPRTRLTMDSQVRSIPFPRQNDLPRDHGLKACTNGSVILELKFDGSIPPWMSTLVRSGKLKPESISKYCMCIDHWMSGTCTRPENLRQVP